MTGHSVMMDQLLRSLRGQGMYIRMLDASVRGKLSLYVKHEGIIYVPFSSP